MSTRAITFDLRSPRRQRLAALRHPRQYPTRAKACTRLAPSSSSKYVAADRGFLRVLPAASPLRRHATDSYGQSGELHSFSLHQTALASPTPSTDSDSARAT